MSEKFIDTLEQTKAKIIDRHISVTANAGSGKTTILKKRFIKIALNSEKEFNPKRVVAITFTRKAASEIFLKISEEIDELIVEDSINGDLKNQLAKIRSELKMANISTIHSFCSNILREFPIEAGVSPNFNELDNSEKYKLLKDAIDTVVTEELSNGNEVLRSIIRDDKKYLFQALEKLLYKRELFEKIDDYLNNHDNFQIYNDFLNNLLNNSIEKLKLLDYNELLTLIINEAPDNKKVYVSKLLDNLNEFVKSINIDEKINNLKYVKTIYNELNTNQIITKDGKLNKRTFKNNDIFNDDRISEFLHKLSEILSICEFLLPSEQSFPIIEKSRCIFDLALKANEYMNEEKDNNNYLDYDDMIIRTRELLKNNEVSEKIRSRYDFIMIDEFQDTNFIQYDIVKELIPELKNVDLSSNINLFIVGDPKQSIYGFRNADVRVFDEATKDIKQSNELKTLDKIISDGNQIIEQNNDEKLGEMVLSVSFRHSPVITLFINKVCSSLMRNKDSEYDVDYNDLICSQQVKDLEKLNNEELLNLDQSFGSVYFLIKNNSQKKENINKLDEFEDINTLDEFERIAIFIKKIVEENYFQKEYKYSDIAILSRASTKFPDLIAALQKYNIPYESTGSKGFFNTPEIVDLISILKFLNNKYDNIALLATLRSIFFSEFPYESFLELAIHQNYYWDYLKQISQQDNNILYKTYKILEDLLELSNKLTIPHLINKIIELTYLKGLLNKFIAKNQILANIQKFIKLARDFEKKGFKNLHDFIKYIDYIVNNKIEEEEEIIISGKNAVNVLTIHKSKGLEFKIVILMNTLGQSSKSDNILIDDNLGVVFQDIIYGDDNNYDKKDNLFTYFITNKNKLKENAEEKRLIYVALTRAREHLIISGTYSRDNPKTYMQQIFQTFGINVNNILKNNIAELNCEGNLKYFYNNEILNKHIGFKIKVMTEDFEPLSDKLRNIEVIHEKSSEIPKNLILLNPIESEIHNEIISATKLLNYKEGLLPYLKRYLLGFEDNEEAESSLSNDDEIIAKDYGSFIHLTFEKIDNWLDENFKIINANLLQTLNNSASIVGISLTEDLINQAFNIVKKVLETQLFKSNKSFIRQSLKEYEIYQPFNDDFIIAKIDFLLKSNDRFLEIWDWKTSKVDNKEEMRNVAGKYEIQMKLYAYILRNLFVDDTIKARLLFTNLAKTNCADEEWCVLFEWTKKDLEIFGTNLNFIIKNIKELI